MVVFWKAWPSPNAYFYVCINIDRHESCSTSVCVRGDGAAREKLYREQRLRMTDCATKPEQRPPASSTEKLGAKPEAIAIELLD
jgi:hypothetical protein